jgi:hypothetical protein
LASAFGAAGCLAGALPCCVCLEAMMDD